MKTNLLKLNVTGGKKGGGRANAQVPSIGYAEFADVAMTVNNMWAL